VLKANWKLRKVLDEKIAPSYYHGDILELRLMNLPEKLTVEFKQKNPVEHKSKLEIVPKELKKPRPPKKRGVRKIDLEKSVFTSHNRKKTKLKDVKNEGDSEHPFLLIGCRYMYKDRRLKKKSPFKKNQYIRLQIDVGDMPPGEKEHSLVVKLELKIKSGTEEESTENIEFHFRRVNKAKKFEEFLIWQHKLLYGPPREKYDPAKGEFSSVHKNPWHLRKGKKRTLVSGTGNNGPGTMVCSPLVGMFLAYWLNYNQYYTNSVGINRFYLTNPAGIDLRLRDNKTSKVKIDKKPVKRNNGYGDFLELIQKNGTKKKDFGNFWDNKPKNQRWNWLDFYNEYENAKDGTIFVCATTGHVWLIAKLGGEFNVKQKYIFNNGKNEKCESGLYKVQASGSGPGSILWKLYKPVKGKKKLSKLAALYKMDEERMAGTDSDAFDYWKNSDRGQLFRKAKKKAKRKRFERDIGQYKKDNIAAKRSGTTLNKIAKILLDAKDSMSKGGSKIFNGSPLVLLNGMLKKKEVERVTVKKEKREVKTVIFNKCGLDLNGKKFEGKQGGRFWLWEVRNVIDNSTGLIKKSDSDLPQKMWLKNRTKIGVDLKHNDCRCFSEPYPYFNGSEPWREPYLYFNGSELSWIDETGKKKESWHAVSGREGFQSGACQQIKNKGPLPEGTWQVRQDQYQRMPDRNWIDKIMAEIGRTAWPGGESAWGRNRIWLSPETGTEMYGRSGFSIHGGEAPGSAGCIDLTHEMPNFVKKFLEYCNDMMLVVGYSD